MSSDPSGSDKVLRGLDGINPGLSKRIGGSCGHILRSFHTCTNVMVRGRYVAPCLRVENPITDEQLSDRIYQSLKKKTTELELGDNVVVGQMCSRHMP